MRAYRSRDGAGRDMGGMGVGGQVVGRGCGEVRRVLQRALRSDSELITYV